MFRRQDAARGGCLRLCKEMGNISIRKTMTIVGNKEMHYSGYEFCQHTHSAFSQRNHCSRGASCPHKYPFPLCVQPTQPLIIPIVYLDGIPVLSAAYFVNKTTVPAVCFAGWPGHTGELTLRTEPRSRAAQKKRGASLAHRNTQRSCSSNARRRRR